MEERARRRDGDEDLVGVLHAPGVAFEGRADECLASGDVLLEDFRAGVRQLDLAGSPVVRVGGAADDAYACVEPDRREQEDEADPVLRQSAIAMFNLAPFATIILQISSKEATDLFKTRIGYCVLFFGE